MPRTQPEDARRRAEREQRARARSATVATTYPATNTTGPQTPSPSTQAANRGSSARAPGRPSRTSTAIRHDGEERGARQRSAHPRAPTPRPVDPPKGQTQAGTRAAARWPAARAASVPPCASAICRLSTSPMPEPFALVVKKGTNRLPGSGRPGPSSSTTTSSSPPAHAPADLDTAAGLERRVGGVADQIDQELVELVAVGGER